ncbi:hypothetical protein ACQP0U_11945 [Micromonospora sp. CA-269861]|uniref:hypothetical protein n=1 Tax=Micromonospora sp. CA-269861 TaxID=3239968 RepID=UPI003D941D2D
MPSTTMLTYRLVSTTEDSGLTTTNPITIHPEHRRTAATHQHQSSRTMVRLEDGAVLLT